MAVAAGLELGVAEDELVEPVAVEVGVGLEQLAHLGDRREIGGRYGEM